MKKVIVSLITIIMIILLCFSSEAYAMGDIIDSGDSFLTIGKNEYSTNKPLDDGALQITSEQIFNIFFVIGAVLAIGIGMIIGIQFIVGSVDEKAKIKETMIPYVVGCIVIFSAFTIWKIVIEVGNEIESGTIESGGTIESEGATGSGATSGGG